MSNIGVGAGLPLQTILDDLRKVENQSLALIESRASTVQGRMSAYGTMKSAIEAFKTASDALGKVDTFGALKSSGGGDFFTTTASSKAIAGQYSIEVSQIATVQTLTSAGQANRDVAIATGAGTVDIQITIDGEVKTLTLNAADTSLEGIVKAINADSTLGASATLINDGSANPHRLLVTAKGTGDTAAITAIQVVGSTELESVIAFSQAPNAGGLPTVLTEAAAKNATLKINGISISSQTNTVTDAIEGVTLTLTKQNAVGETSNLSITRDDSVTSKAVNTFVTAYNNLQGIIKTLTSYNVDNQKGSALTGDSLARQVQSQVREGLNVAISSGAVRTLSQMGITTNPSDGVLKVDADKLAKALKDNMVDVQALFSGESGISKKMASVADTFVKSGGLISSATDSMTTTLKDLEKQYAAASDRIDQKMETYRQQFTRLDTMVAQMNSVSSYLTQQLSMLANIGNEK
jgi:flagellar hook-associated protein 2